MSGPTVRAFWSHLGSHASMADTVYARVGPADAFWWLPRERDADVEHRSRWMLRVVDAPAAIAARGFPAAVSLRVPLQIADGARPANSGRWQLTVAGGAGALDPLDPGPGTLDPLNPAPGTLDPLDPAPGTLGPPGPAGVPDLDPAADPALMLGARGLAALYAGTPLVTLRQAGLAAGGTAADDAALDAAFAATPYMLDSF